MFSRLLTTLVFAVAGHSAMADPVPIPLLSPDDLQEAVDPNVFQGVRRTEKVGAVYFPDRVLSYQVEHGVGDAAQVIAQWARTHGFYLVPFSVSILPLDDNIPEKLDVAAGFTGLGQLTNQPIILDTFPKTGFKPGAVTGSGEVKIDGNLQIKPLPTGTSVGAQANAALKFNYTPAYANVISGFASGHAFWQYERTQDQYPVGEIPMKLLIAVPNTYSEKELILRFDVRARFSRKWWVRGMAVASYPTVVALP